MQNHLNLVKYVRLVFGFDLNVFSIIKNIVLNQIFDMQTRVDTCLVFYAFGTTKPKQLKLLLCC